MKPMMSIFLAVAVATCSAAMAQEMSGADKQALIANFLEADTNNDGILYRSEFELLMKLNSNDNLGKAAIVVRTGSYDRAFARLDLNGDGAITQEEFRALAEERG